MYAVKLSTVPRRRDRLEVLGERLEVPGDARGQRRRVHVLDVLERAHDQVVVLGPGRRDREAAVAGHDGGDAVVRRRPQRRVPEHLRVVVGVDVDEARARPRSRRRRARGRRAGPAPISRDHARRRSRTSATRPGRAGAVDDRAAADDDLSASRLLLRAGGCVSWFGRGTGGRPAVDRQHDPGDLRGPVAGQEERRRWPRRAAGPGAAAAASAGRSRRCRSVVLMLVAMCAGRDAVDPDAVLGEVDRDRPGELDDRRLRRAVGHQPAPGVDAGDRRGVDDRAAAVLGHVPGRALAADHRRRRG